MPLAKKGQKRHYLGPADGADFVALRREADDNQTLTDERNLALTLT